MPAWQTVTENTAMHDTSPASVMETPLRTTFESGFQSRIGSNWTLKTEFFSLSVARLQIIRMQMQNDDQTNAIRM